MEVIQKEDDTFIICDDPDKLKTGSGYISVINQFTYKKVKQFVELFQTRLESLLNDKSFGKGTSLYWEEDYHQKIVKFLKLMMPEHNERHISNALSALGY